MTTHFDAGLPRPALSLDGHRDWPWQVDPTGHTIAGAGRAAVVGLPWTDAPTETLKAFGLMALRHSTRFTVVADPLSAAAEWFGDEPHRGFISAAICELALDEPEALSADPLTAKRMMAIARRGWPLPNVIVATLTRPGEDAGEVSRSMLDLPASRRLIAMPAGRVVGDLMLWHLAGGLTARWGPGADGRPEIGQIVGTA